MELKEMLVEYKKVTEKLIEAFRNDSGEEYLEKRQVIIEELKLKEFDKEQFKAIAEELNILELEKEAHKVLSDERATIKREIGILKKRKEAQRTYGNGFRNINFINTKS